MKMTRFPMYLKYNDVFSLGTFLALRYSELYALTFHQSFEASARDGAEVCKNIGTRILLDEAEALGFVKPLNGAS